MYSHFPTVGLSNTIFASSIASSDDGAYSIPIHVVPKGGKNILLCITLKFILFDVFYFSTTSPPVGFSTNTSVLTVRPSSHLSKSRTMGGHCIHIRSKSYQNS